MKYHDSWVPNKDPDKLKQNKNNMLDTKAFLFQVNPVKDMGKYCSYGLLRMNESLICSIYAR